MIMTSGPKPFRQRAIAPGGPWIPTGFPLRWNADRSLSYLVVDERLEGVLTVVVDAWPTVDTEGRLEFGTEAASASVDQDDFMRLLSQRRRPAGRGRPSEAFASRPIRIGDAFAARLRRTESLRVAGGEFVVSDPARWIVGPVYDVTAQARAAAKLAYYAATARVVSTDTVRMEVAEALQGDPYNVLAPPLPDEG